MKHIGEFLIGMDAEQLRSVSRYAARLLREKSPKRKLAQGDRILHRGVLMTVDSLDGAKVRTSSGLVIPIGHCRVLSK